MAAIAGAVGRAGKGVALGIGDDAAVLQELRGQPVLCCDALVEDIDFDLAWASGADIGHKAAAVNLSDLAAMGATPRGLLLSLALPASTPTRLALDVVGAVAKLGDHYGAPLIGGDLSSTRGPIVLSVTAVGDMEGRRPLRRGTARRGDVVLVSGQLGGAAAGLALLVEGGAGRRGRHTRRRDAGRDLSPRAIRDLIGRQLRPTPRLALGVALARWGLVRACADVSDGLGRDVLHLVGGAQGVDLSGAALPIAPGVGAVARRVGRDPFDLALCGGEDFELVLAVRSRDVSGALALGRRCGVPLSAIGVVTAQRGVRLDGKDLVGAAFEHWQGDGPRARPEG